VVSITPWQRFSPGERAPVPIGQGAGWAPEPVWTQRLEEKSACLQADFSSSLCRGSNPGRPVRSQPVHWLSYRGSTTHLYSTEYVYTFCGPHVAFYFTLEQSDLYSRMPCHDLIKDGNILRNTACITHILKFCSAASKPMLRQRIFDFKGNFNKVGTLQMFNKTYKSENNSVKFNGDHIWTSVHKTKCKLGLVLQEIWGSHDGDDYDVCLLGSSIFYFTGSVLFRARNCVLFLISVGHRHRQFFKIISYKSNTYWYRTRIYRAIQKEGNTFTC
jgi:hypothetical protein